ncbi:tetratricopeptide repeat protein [Streptomyces aculeolatus]
MRAEQAFALAECARVCTGYLAGLTAEEDAADPPPPSGGPGPARTALVAALGELLGTAPPPRRETVGAELFDTLLRAGDRAVETGGERELLLAVELADTGVALRAKSRAAWRLRAHALDALGRAAGAAEAYERTLALGSTHPETPVLLAAAREKRECLAAAVELFPADTGGPGDTGDTGDTADPGREPAGGAGGEPGAAPAGRAFAAVVGAEAVPAVVREAFTAYVGEQVGRYGAGDARVRELAGLYGTYSRLLDQGRMADPLLGGARPVGVADFRGLVAGKTACVVVGPDRFEDAGDYELVVRCDDFRGGERADVHAVADPDCDSWHRPAGVRLLFADPGETWREAVRRTVPGAQDGLGDASLRRPLADPALLGDGGWGPGTSAAFTVLRLMDHLDVSPRLDVHGAGRLRPEERRWIASRAKDRTKTRTALR